MSFLVYGREIKLALSGLKFYPGKGLSVFRRPSFVFFSDTKFFIFDDDIYIYNIYMYVCMYVSFFSHITDNAQQDDLCMLYKLYIYITYTYIYIYIYVFIYIYIYVHVSFFAQIMNIRVICICYIYDIYVYVMYMYMLYICDLYMLCMYHMHTNIYIYIYIYNAIYADVYGMLFYELFCICY